MLISLNVVVSTALQTPCERLADRVNKAYLIALGGLGGALGLAIFLFAGEFWHLVVLNIWGRAMYGRAFPSHTASAMEHGQRYGMGTVMSVLMMAPGVGMMVGPALFGSLASQSGLGGGGADRRVRRPGQHRPPAVSRPARSGEGNHAARHRPLLEQLVGFVDLFERQRLGDQLVDFQPAVHVHVDQAGHVNPRPGRAVV